MDQPTRNRATDIFASRACKEWEDKYELMFKMHKERALIILLIQVGLIAIIAILASL